MYHGDRLAEWEEVTKEVQQVAEQKIRWKRLV